MDERVFREALCRMQLFGDVNKKTNRLELVFFLRQDLHGMRFFTRHKKPIQFELLGPETFFRRTPWAECNFLSCATKNSFLREALSKTQDSGANTRLALIIFKGGNGNWIFLPCLAEARLSRDCFSRSAPVARLLQQLTCLWLQHCTGAPWPNGTWGCNAYL